MKPVKQASALPARAAFVCIMVAGVLTGCQATGGGALTATTDRSEAVALLQTINSQAQTCWMKSKDKAFRAYRVIPELDTRVGTPRILLVSAKAAQGLPQLVIEAEGKPARLTTYGPLTSDPVSARINKDILRWTSGKTGCA